MTPTAIPALLRREVLDNRIAFLWTPAVLLALMLLVVFGAVGIASRLDPSMHIAFEMEDGTTFEGGGLAHGLNKLAAADPAEQRTAVTVILHAVTVPVFIALPFVIFFTLLSALYEERRDRSILFWKSMPVPDWAEVAAKFAAATLIAPAAALAMAVVAQLVAWLLFLGITAGVGAPLAPWFAALPTVAYQWLALAAGLLTWALWAAPVWGWVLFCSAFAPRSPFGFAVVPPLVLVIIESIWFRTHHFSAWLGKHLLAFPALEGMPRGEVGAERLITIKLFDMLGSFSDPDLWLGLAIAAFFLAAATWTRRHAL